MRWLDSQKENSMRFAAAGLVLLVCYGAAPAYAQYAEPDIRFFYPLVTRRPVIERELEFRLDHTKGLEARETEAALAIEWPILPRLQFELEVPFVVVDPNEGKTVAGFGDIELQAKLQVFKSVQHRALVAFGLEHRLPSGSRARGLGGEHAIEPFLTAGMAVGPFDLIGEVAYEWVLNGEEHPREQEFSASLAVAYPASRWFIPLLELVTVTQTRGPTGTEREAGGEESLRHKTQVYLVPGFNMRPRPGWTLRAGVEVPVTTAKSFDYRVLSALVIEF
jgi:hypothetical protein